MNVSRTLWPLVGRERSVDLLRSYLTDRATRAVLVTGEAGVGKTRLVTDVTAGLAAHGRRVVRITPPPESAAFPLSALAPLLVTGSGDQPLDRDPLQLLAHLRALLRTGRGPVPIVFADDFAGFDSLSALLVSQLMLTQDAVLVATVRIGDPLPELEHSRWSGDGAIRLELGALNERDCRRLLTAALGGAVGATTVMRLYRASSGLPLHLRELVASAVDDGSLTEVDGVWHLSPGTVRHPGLLTTLRSRLSRLAPGEVALLQRLALCQPFELDDFPGGGTDPVLLEQLAAVEGAGLIVVDMAEDGTTYLRLAHGAYADLVRVELPKLLARRLLLESVQAVRSRGRGARDALRLAMWELEATGRADPATLLPAARAARRQHDYAAVQRLAAAAVAGKSPTIDVEARMLLGEALRESGKPAEAAAVLERAVLGSAPSELSARVAYARAAMIAQEPGGMERALALLGDARRTLPDQAGPLSIARASLLNSQSRTEEALAELATVDPAVARRPENAGTYLSAAVPALLGAGRSAEALKLADELLPALSSEADPIHHGMPEMMRSWAMLEERGPAAAWPVTQAALRDCLKSGVDRLICFASHEMCLVAVMLGRLGTAERWARETLSVARGVAEPEYRKLGLIDVALVYALRGRGDEARNLLRRLDDSDPDPELYPFLRIMAEGWTLAAQGALSEAIAAFVDGAQAAADRGHWLMTGVLLSDVVRLGSPGLAVDGLSTVVSRTSSPLMELRLRQATAALSRDWRSLAEVGQEWAELGAELFAAEAAMAASELARRSGDPRAAAALGAKAAELAARCQGASTPGLMSVGSVSPLSSREREVAAMAANGLRSRDIAQALTVSTRTVDHHLQSVYGKLGIAGRRELADALRMPATS